MMTDAEHALGHRAIVIGGSLAGMLAARAIAPADVRDRVRAALGGA